MSNEKKANYVVSGAQLRCTRGNKDAVFNPLFIQGSFTGRNLQGVDMDYGRPNIIGDFGTCTGRGGQLCDRIVSGPWHNTHRKYGYFYNEPSTIPSLRMQGPPSPHPTVIRARMLTTNSVLCCAPHNGVIYVVDEGQELKKVEKMEKLIELRKQVREVITKHYKEQDNAAEQALRTIERLNMNDSAAANKGPDGILTSAPPENNPYKLIAWIVLLEPKNDSERVELLGEFRDQVIDGEYKAVGILEDDDDKFEDVYFDTLYISKVKEDAYNLAPETPMKTEDISSLGDIGIAEGVNRGGYDNHKGIDLRTHNQTGKSIYSTVSGKVTRANYNVVNTVTGGRGYGNYIEIKDNKNRTHIFGHMHPLNLEFGSEFATNSNKAAHKKDVNEKQFILPGKKIGNSGNTGNSTGAHLHYEVQPSGSGQDSSNCLDSRLRKNRVLPDIQYGNPPLNSFLRD